MIFRPTPTLMSGDRCKGYNETSPCMEVKSYGREENREDESGRGAG